MMYLQRESLVANLTDPNASWVVTLMKNDSNISLHKKLLNCIWYFMHFSSFVNINNCK